ncbi:MAG: hypothetical protein ACRD2G_11985 [Terriglobia bacterium]
MIDHYREFTEQWLTKAGWKVVPDESGGRLFPEDIPRIVSALNGVGCLRCLAVTTEDLGDMPPCYMVAVSEEGFRELNDKLGMFQFLLTDEARSWAISCTVFYNLFAGPEKLVEAMLGKSIAEAQKKYLRIATEIAEARGDPDDFHLQVARRYAT